MIRPTEKKTAALLFIFRTTIKMAKNTKKPISDVITMESFNFINRLNTKPIRKKTEKERGENNNSFSSKRSTDLPITRFSNLFR